MVHLNYLIRLQRSPLILAQEQTTPLGDLTQRGIDLAIAVVILIVGLLIAWGASALTKNLLKRTNIDNQIASWVTGDGGGESPPVENWIAGLVFWLIFLFSIVAFLQTLQLETVSEPLNALLGEIASFIPQLLGAALLLGVAWLVASLVKLVVLRVLRSFNLDQRLGEQVSQTPEPEAGQQQFSLSETIANTLYWLIFLLFLPSILSTLELEGTLTPVQEMVNGILSILPNIFAAVLIALVGWLIAQVVRRIVTSLLASAGADRLGTRFGLTGATPSQSLSWLLGTLVYVLILIPVAISALEALQIEAIAVPAIAMLNQVLNALPKIFTAAAVLIIAYILGQYISELVTNVLTGIGFNNVFQWLGFAPQRPAEPTAPEPPAAEPVPPPETATPTTTVPRRTPSELVGVIILVGIMLIATLTAVNIVEIPALTALVAGIVLIFGRILAGLIVLAIGLYLANLAFNVILSSNLTQARLLAQAARVTIMIFVIALALQQIGIAASIVNLAFGLLFGSVAVAVAIAFGLGSREVAGEQVRNWVESFKSSQKEE